MPTDSPQTPKPQSPTNEEPLPIKSVFLASLLPALLGLSVGLFILPPRMGFDPVAGLLTWMNFVKGGTWNTIPIPDPNNIAQTIEIAVTWWPPGQYLFLGLLNLAGLSFGHAALLLAFLSTLSGAIGLAVLGKELGAPSRALPWIAGALACSQYNLVNYNTFSGGEALTMALWPWVAIVAWKLKNNDKLLICTLPPLFLLGSFIKYSFAIYALCILLFIWSERLANLNFIKSDSLFKRTKKTLLSSIPLAATGIIYLAGQYYLFEMKASSLQKSVNYLYSLKEIIAYSPISPLTSVSSLKISLIKLGAGVLLKDYNEFWSQLASILAFISPLAIALYLSLIKKRQQTLRFFGIAALTTVSILSTLHILGSSISLDDRHYQQAGSLLLIIIASYAFNKRKLSLLPLFLIIATMAFSIARFSRSTYGILDNHSPVYTGKSGLAFTHPKSVIKELKSIVYNPKRVIITIPSPEIAVELEFIRAPLIRFLPTYGHGSEVAHTYRGRVSQITIVEPTSNIKNIKSRFIDYAEDEWTSYEIDGWTFWQVGYPERVEQEESVEAGLGDTEN